MAAEEVPVPVPVPVPMPAPCPPPKIWEGSLEVGANGTEGNSQSFNFRFLANAKRKTKATELTLNARYLNTVADNLTTANRAFFEGRNEWLLGDSPWSLYVHETTEYDEFRPFDARLTADAGIAYQLIKTDFTTLQGRAGPGVSHEIGGPDDEFVPEAVFGMSFEQKLSARSKFTASTDYFPDMSDFGEFRLNSQANLEFLLDEQLHLSLKFGVLDRYDSTPQGAKPNDFDYSATIMWSF